jgi:bifunctional UDP-N-acetylglucosamine pyrophosphorylase / glucosamine-1-phosphate N-acetyltransferase
MSLPMTCVILAGGGDHRFQGEIPRSLQQLNDLPVLEHVRSAAQSAGAENIIVVAGEQSIVDSVEGRAAVVRQEELRGSGHALMLARSYVENHPGDVLVLYGDRPLLKPETLRCLVRGARESEAACALLSVCLEQSNGNARVIRGLHGTVSRVSTDCQISAEESQIKEFVAGVYYFQRRRLLDAFEKVIPSTGIWLITELVNVMAAGYKVTAWTIPDPDEVMGIYSPEDLLKAERCLQRTSEARREKDSAESTPRRELVYIMGERP